VNSRMTSKVEVTNSGTLVVYNEIGFDETGFQRPGEDESKIRWDQITRVALCYEIHPLAVADWDYWAFQTSDPNLIIWVRISDSMQSKSFSSDVERRFGKVLAPSMKNWADADQTIRTYVIWPKADIGKSLYLLKKHRWSLKGHLVHRNLNYCASLKGKISI
jgi:hypothetical protein